MNKKCIACGSARFESKIVAFNLELRGETFAIDAEAFVCLECGEHLADTEMMAELQTKASDAYRSKHKLLTSKEIAAFRGQLGMSQQDFANYLAVGVASIKRWERAGIQEKSQDELIRLKCDPDFAQLNSRLVQERLKAL